MILDLTTHESDFELNYSETEFEKFVLVTQKDTFDEPGSFSTWIIAPFDPSFTLEENEDETISNPPALIIYFPDSHSVCFNRFEPSYVTSSELEAINKFFDLNLHI